MSAVQAGAGAAPVAFDAAWGAATVLGEMLRPIQPLLDHPGLTNLNINGPGKAFVAIRGEGKRAVELPYDFADLQDIAVCAAALNQEGDVDDTAPFAGGVLPGGHRVQIARPPATRSGIVALSIRKPSLVTPTIADLKAGGVFEGTVGHTLARTGRRRQDLRDLHRAGDYPAFLDAALAAGLNVALTGPQDTGKSHDLRAFTTSIPRHRRIATVEDLPEAINLHQPDVLPLFYNKGSQGTSSHTADHCIEAALRMATEVLLVQEIRDGAGFALLSALLAGLQVLFTFHANSAAEARGRLRSMVKMHPAGMARADEEVMHDLRATLDVIVYCKRDGDNYRIEQVLYEPDTADAAS